MPLKNDFQLSLEFRNCSVLLPAISFQYHPQQKKVNKYFINQIAGYKRCILNIISIGFGCHFISLVDADPYHVRLPWLVSLAASDISLLSALKYARHNFSK